MQRQVRAVPPAHCDRRFPAGANDKARTPAILAFCVCMRLVVPAAHAAGRLCGGFIALGPHDVMFFHCAGGLLQVVSFKIIMNHSHSAIFNNENALGGRARPPGSLLYRAEALHQGVLRKHLSSFDKVHLGFENSIVPDIDEYGVRLLGRVGETSDIVC